MTIARSEDISKNDTCILNLLKKHVCFRKHFGIALLEEIRIAKFCTEDADTFNDQTEYT